MHFAQRVVLALSLVFLVQGCQPEEGAKPEPVSLDTIDQKAFYGMGVAMAKMTEQQFAAFDPTPEERELVITGFRETYIDEMPRVDLAVVGDRELRIVGTLMYQYADYEEAVQRIASGDINTKPLETRHFPFAEFSAAYAFIDKEGPRSMKVFIDL
jgi:threonine dehydrogenase-like Zn-dependent dehydrogenase